MQIDHSANELATGQKYILTLQDSSVLDYDQQDGEVLENIDLQDSFRQRIANKRKSKLSRHVNSKFLPIHDADDEDDIDAWQDPSETNATNGLGTGEALLSKYDDVEDLAMKKKRANRIQIGGEATTTSNSTNSNAKAKTSTNGGFNDYFTKRQTGSDYYATNDEDPLLKSSSFKKKKEKAGNKRTRINPLALADNDEEDIVTVLEGAAASTTVYQHLATKKARQEAQVAQNEK